MSELKTTPLPFSWREGAPLKDPFDWIMARVRAPDLTACYLYEDLPKLDPVVVYIAPTRNTR
jgi:hypothetical protein